MKMRWILWVWLPMGWAVAQEPMFMEAATHPAKGNHYTRALWADDSILLKHAVGLSSSFALLGDLKTDSEEISEGDVRFKLQILRRDTGPIDTWRTSMTGGASWRLEGSTSARVGVVSSLIRSRHGVNAQLDWNFAEDKMERGQVNASYLYRLSPAQFHAGSKAAWYVMSESLNTVSSDGDLQSDLSGGILLEARRWALEISYRQDGSENYLGIGCRWLW